MVACRSPGVLRVGALVVAPNGNAGENTTSTGAPAPRRASCVRMPSAVRLRTMSRTAEPNGTLFTRTESQSGGRCGESVSRRAGASASIPSSPRMSGVSTIDVAKNCCGTAVSSGL